ncbi:MAG: hypothetical protein IK018_05690 [Lachnospiraceae bacterium]|nr:hypothetical protein [Lachnospiraceae bacterium]MBR5993276.1 hypothetical protein [Lachnospiraceae bacterium]
MSNTNDTSKFISLILCHKPVIYTVRAGRMHRDGFKFYRSVNGVWLTKEVPVEYLAKER